MLFTFLIYLTATLLLVLVVFYTERKLSAFMQDRLGPMEVGKFGILQAIADLLKMLQKEDIVPASADRKLFLIAPLLLFTVIFAGFAVIPFTSSFIGANIEIGLFFLLAIISLDIIGILLAGWSSNSKFSVLGAMRGVAQMISYEIPLGLSVLSVVMIAQSLNLQEISLQQSIYAKEANYFLGIKAWGIDITKVGGILSWNIVRMPFLSIGYVIFFIASLAECNRAPFDLPESESELIGGFHTEYSGFRWGIFFLAEYAMMILVSLVGVILFLGSWNTPLPNIGVLKLADWTTGTLHSFYGNFMAAFWLITKMLIIVMLQIAARWTYPRLRVDQLMYVSWKVLTPIALGLVLLAGIWRLWMI